MAGHAGQVEIHDRHVRRLALDRSQAGLCRRGFAHDLDLLLLEKLAQAGAKKHTVGR